MKIVNNRLVAEATTEKISQYQSPNKGGIIVPEYLIIHYTAGRSAESSVATFMNPAEKKSAHLVIGRDGSIHQMMDFTRKAWHAGVSHWGALDGLNSYSIGIELDNPGKLTKVNGKYVAWFGKAYPESDVMEAQHKNQTHKAFWHTYTEAQLEACIAVSKVLVKKYGLKDILGHDDIAPDRKEDPGPAFPMASFKAHVMGRDDLALPMYEVVKSLVNVRKGPGLDYEVITQLQKGAMVTFLDAQNGWFKVQLNGDHPEGLGWIHNTLIAKKQL